MLLGRIQSAALSAVCVHACPRLGTGQIIVCTTKPTHRLYWVLETPRRAVLSSTVEEGSHFTKRDHPVLETQSRATRYGARAKGRAFYHGRLDLLLWDTAPRVYGLVPIRGALQLITLCFSGERWPPTTNYKL